MPHRDGFTTQLPRQRISESEKDEDWKQSTIDAIIDLSRFNPPFRREDEREKMRKAYLYYNGNIVDEDYTHVTEPYGNKRENFPAKMRNYPIIKPVVDLLIGEKSRRPSEWTIKVDNDDVVNRKNKEKSKKLQKNIIQNFMAELQENTDVDTQDLGPNERPEPPKELIKRFDDEYRDSRALQGEAVLDYLYDDLELDREFLKGFKHFLISGEVHAGRGLGSPDIRYNILNPLQVDYEKSPDTEFIEDGQWACHRRLSTVNDVLDAFYDELDPEEVSQLENPNRDYDPFVIYSDDTYTPDNDGRLLEVYEVYWKSMKKLNIVTYIDEMGATQQREEYGDYEPLPDESVETYWVTETWQGFRIDEDIYARVKPVEVHRGDLDNKSEAKLPINGTRYSDMNAPNTSLVMLGIPYQISYNIYKYRLDNAIARSKDIIAQLDINLIPDDWDMDEFMYNMEATGIAWMDYGDHDLSPQHQTVLDMSVQVIQDMTALLQSILQEWERVSGVSRQRQGRIFASETKGGSEQAIVQSSYITEPYFNQYSHFEEREFAAILDYSKVKWANGKSLSRVTPEGSEEILEIDGIEHMESEYGVRVSNSSEDMENLEQLRDLSQAMLQNGVQLSKVMDIMEANSITEVKDKVEKAEQSQKKLRQAQRKAEQQQAQQEMQLRQKELESELQQTRMDNQTKMKLKQMELEQDDEEMETEEDIAEMEADTDIEVAEIKAESTTNGST